MNTPRFDLLTAAVAVAALSCAAPARQLAPRAVARATPAAPSPARPTAATTPASSPSPPPAAPEPEPGVDTRCIARPRDAFHLRPRPVHASTGTEFPAGTEVQVLGTAFMRRGDAELVHGRVLATGAEGFLFVHATELSAQCPVVWHVDNVSQATGPFAYYPDAPRDAVRPGGHRAPAGVLGPAAQTGTVRVLERHDFDGDGRVDELLGVGINVTTGRGGEFLLVVRRQGADGKWRGTFVSQAHDHEHAPTVYDGVVVSGGAAYVQTSDCQVLDLDTLHPWDQCGVSLYRLRPTGEVALVFSGTYGVGEDWRITPGDGESLELTGRVSGRHQRLRWNAAQFALLPEESWRPDFADPEPQPEPR